MKKLLSFLLLLTSIAGVTLPAQSNQISSTASVNTIDWNDEAAINALFEKLIDHYEKNQPKALFHTLYEEAYGSKPDYLGITILSSLEKFAFDYMNQNPKMVKRYIDELEKATPKNAEFTIDDILMSLFLELREQANILGLNLTNDQIEMLTILQLSAIWGFAADGKITFNLFKEIVEYANQQIQK